MARIWKGCFPQKAVSGSLQARSSLRSISDAKKLKPEIFRKWRKTATCLLFHPEIYREQQCLLIAID
ncbi:hypothetical protein HC766_08755 [Candidatus Gracilibacteria bacterium]|nr:hypothetical protein [Candidatus Gracilibacteria bacterium]